MSLGIALALSILGALFCFTIIVLPAARFDWKTPSYSKLIIPHIESREEAARRFLAKKTRDELMQRIESEAKHRTKRTTSNAPYSTTIGFYVNWNEASYNSLRDHINHLTYIMPEWYYLTPEGTWFDSRFLNKHDSRDPDVIKLAQANKVPIIPMLDNNANQVFQWKRLKALLLDTDAQRKIAIALRDEFKAKHFAGINVDLEPGWVDDPEKLEAQRLMHDALPGFIKILKDTFQPAGLLVTEDVHPDDKSYYDYARLGELNDIIIAMFYDWHTNYSKPGPIAPQWWVEDTANKFFEKVDSSKVIIGIGNYCYDWHIKTDKVGDIDLAGTSSKDILPALSVGRALPAARDADATIEMDDEDLNPYFTYVNPAGEDHIIYMLDAVTAYNQIHALVGYNARGVALWHLGTEDPGIWKFFSDDGRMRKPVDIATLQRVEYESGNNIEDELDAKGEIKTVQAVAEPGLRKLKMDSDGVIVSETYTKYPSPYLIEGYGQNDKTIALTFDDGPDPRYTPRILAVLKKYNVPATFFIIGSYAEKNPSLVKDEWDQGCEIGNHTFTHPEFSGLSKLRAQAEVNATQRIIESITGHSTRLFRPPFGFDGDTPAKTERQVRQLYNIQSLGYVSVDFNIDSHDWQLPGTKVIVNNVENPQTPGNIVLMHDGGGHSRDQTIAALPQVITYYKNLGYRFVTVTGLLHGYSKDAFFPPVGGKQTTFAGFDLAVFETSFLISRIISITFIISLFLGICRILFIAPLAVLQSIKARKAEGLEYDKPITVIVPAYNEGNVICRTIHSVLDGDYPNVRVIMVDDGSTDGTYAAVHKVFGSNPNVMLIRKENGGKASALNLGIASAETEVVVCVDADTLFARDTISKMVRHFCDPNVGAVAGNVKVGNRQNPLTVWQSLEYITSQNFDRRAYAALNAVTVVPGAVGAWRKSVVEEVGGYDTDTLAEDTDVTFKIRLLGYGIVAENDALAFTEAPDSVHALAKQRFRWSFGTLQCLWKHRSAMFKPKNGAFGMLVMPAMWVYNIFLQAFSPIIDIAVVLALLGHGLLMVSVYYAAFFVIDFLGSALALALDHEDFKQLIWLFWQRFFYRQFMYYVIIKSLLAALRGGTVGWGKLNRKDSVVNRA